MSERGSFCTEYLYCGKCAVELKKLFDEFNLKESDKYFKPEYIYVVDGRFHIIAGKIGGLYSGEELNVFDFRFRDKIEQTICCPVSIAVLSDDHDRRKILEFNPKPFIPGVFD